MSRLIFSFFQQILLLILINQAMISGKKHCCCYIFIHWIKLFIWVIRVGHKQKHHVVVYMWKQAHSSAHNILTKWRWTNSFPVKRKKIFDLGDKCTFKFAEERS